MLTQGWWTGYENSQELTTGPRGIMHSASMYCINRVFPDPCEICRCLLTGEGGDCVNKHDINHLWEAEMSIVRTYIAKNELFKKPDL